MALTPLSCSTLSSFGCLAKPSQANFNFFVTGSATLSDTKYFTATSHRLPCYWETRTKYLPVNTISLKTASGGE